MLQGYREVYNQAFGVPVAGDLATKLTFHDPVGEQAAKPFGFRLPDNGRPAMLLPCQQEFVLFLDAINLDAARWRRQCPILYGVRRKLMQDEAKARNGIPVDRHVWAVYDDAIAVFGALRIDIGTEDRSDERVQGRVPVDFQSGVDQARSGE